MQLPALHEGNGTFILDYVAWLPAQSFLSFNNFISVYWEEDFECILILFQMEAGFSQKDSSSLHLD